MICIGKYSFILFFLLANIFLGFLKEHMVFGWEISLFLFLMSSFFSYNMANNCYIATAMVQAIEKNKIKEETEKRLSIEEWLKKMDELKLSSPNDFLNFLRMDEGTYEELLNLIGPKILKQDTNDDFFSVKKRSPCFKVH